MAETLKGVFAASMSVLKADLSLDIEATLHHSKTNLDDTGVGSAFFGSTGCGQLISVSEKKEFIDSLSKMKFKEQILIGTWNSEYRPDDHSKCDWQQTIKLLENDFKALLVEEYIKISDNQKNSNEILSNLLKKLIRQSLKSQLSKKPDVKSHIIRL